MARTKWPYPPKVVTVTSSVSPAYPIATMVPPTPRIAYAPMGTSMEPFAHGVGVPASRDGHVIMSPMMWTMTPMPMASGDQPCSCGAKKVMKRPMAKPNAYGDFRIRSGLIFNAFAAKATSSTERIPAPGSMVPNVSAAPTVLEARNAVRVPPRAQCFRRSGACWRE
jgi:hypothetical protein